MYSQSESLSQIETFGVFSDEFFFVGNIFVNFFVDSDTFQGSELSTENKKIEKKKYLSKNFKNLNSAERLRITFPFLLEKKNINSVYVKCDFTSALTIKCQFSIRLFRFSRNRMEHMGMFRGRSITHASLLIL